MWPTHTEFVLHQIRRYRDCAPSSRTQAYLRLRRRRRKLDEDGIKVETEFSRAAREGVEQVYSVSLEHRSGALALEQALLLLEEGSKAVLENKIPRSRTSSQRSPRACGPGHLHPNNPTGGHSWGAPAHAHLPNRRLCSTLRSDCRCCPNDQSSRHPEHKMEGFRRGVDTKTNVCHGVLSVL